MRLAREPVSSIILLAPVVASSIRSLAVWLASRATEPMRSPMPCQALPSALPVREPASRRAAVEVERRALPRSGSSMYINRAPAAAPPSILTRSPASMLLSLVVGYCFMCSFLSVNAALGM
jgi:hypothetical protein